MARDRDEIFDNLDPPKYKARAVDVDDDLYDDADRAFREVAFYQPEGPLRVRPAGRGGGALGAPAIYVGPAVTGSTSVGSTLTCSQGIWLGSPTGYAYQWQRNGANIAGQTGATYVVVAGDHLNSISCIVTATNAQGSAAAASNAVAIP